MSGAPKVSVTLYRDASLVSAPEPAGANCQAHLHGQEESSVRSDKLLSY